MKYYINGWQEGKSYFLSFGFTQYEINRMTSGESITRENNTYEIRDTD